MGYEVVSLIIKKNHRKKFWEWWQKLIVSHQVRISVEGKGSEK